MTNTPDSQFVRRAKGYAGRDRLDQASMRFRRAVARLAREGTKDPETLAKLEPIITAAVTALDGLTQQALQAEGNSTRHRDALAKEQEKVERILRKAVRQGSPRAAELLERFTERPVGSRRDHTAG